ncbi:MAG: hypothetical protein A2135_00220 [Actinobacteria bacterium RBG_16_67_15]|nr:MAG: hypothetical protein A2135_00220 [Actinobacteria bacterium RBG_16_67_15]
MQYSGDPPDGLVMVAGQCAGVDMSCDYAFEVLVRPETQGVMGEPGTVDFLGLLEVITADGWLVVDAETIRAEGMQLNTFVCSTDPAGARPSASGPTSTRCWARSPGISPLRICWWFPAMRSIAWTRRTTSRSTGA